MKKYLLLMKIFTLSLFISSYIFAGMGISAEDKVVYAWEPELCNLTEERLLVYWKQTENSHIQISDTQLLMVNLTNYRTLKTRFDVRLSCDNDNIKFNTNLITSDAVYTQKTTSVTFAVSSLGVEQQIENIPITVTATDYYSDEELGNETVYATLLPTLIPGTTYLELLTIEKGTDKPARFVSLIIQYPANGQGEQMLVWTDINGYAMFNLKMRHGGAYIGDILIQCSETDTYYSASEVSEVHLDFNQITFEVDAKNQETLDNGTIWVLPIVIVLIVVIVIILLLLLRRKK